VIEMPERYDVKITVLKRFNPSEVFKISPVTPVNPNPKACELVKDGQEFIVKGGLRMPEGFCASAWSSLSGRVMVLAFGGNFPWYKEKGVNISCCADGLRPVVFKLERI